MAVDHRLGAGAILVKPRGGHLLLDLADGRLGFGDPCFERRDPRLARTGGFLLLARLGVDALLFVVVLFRRSLLRCVRLPRREPCGLRLPAFSVAFLPSCLVAVLPCRLAFLPSGLAAFLPCRFLPCRFPPCRLRPTRARPVRWLGSSLRR